MVVLYLVFLLKPYPFYSKKEKNFKNSLLAIYDVFENVQTALVQNLVL